MFRIKSCPEWNRKCRGILPLCSDTAAGQTRIYWGGLRDLLRRLFVAYLRPLTYPASLAAFWAGWYFLLTL